MAFARSGCNQNESCSTPGVPIELGLILASASWAEGAFLPPRGDLTKV
jgi:hypothetical protein